MKKNILVGVILIIIIVVLGVSFSFAFFSALITGVESATTITAEGGELKIVYSGGASIDAPAIVPSSDPWANKTFTVTGTNTTNVNMGYSIKIMVTENTFSAGSIKYTLSGTNNSSNGSLATAVTTLTTVSSGTVIGSGYFTKGNNLVHTYQLKMYFPDSGEDQTADMGASFGGYILIEGAKV